MKKRTVKLIVMLAILALCAGGYFAVNAIVTAQEAQAQAQAQEEQETSIPLIDEADTPVKTIEYFSVESDCGLTIEMSEDKYRLADLPLYPLSQSETEDLVAVFTDVSATSEVVGADADSDAETYGFDEPSYRGKIIFAPEESATKTYSFLLGDYNAFSDEYYFRFEGESTVYTVSTELADAMETIKTELLAQESVPTVNADDTTAVSLQIGDKVNDMTDSTAIAKLVPLYTTVAKASVLDPMPTEEALAQYGIDEQKRLVYTYTETISVTNDDGETTGEVERDAKVGVTIGGLAEDGYAVMFDGLDYVYLADKTAVEDILTYIDYVPTPEEETTDAAEA